jgi:hypothetical protein
MFTYLAKSIWERANRMDGKVLHWPNAILGRGNGTIRPKWVKG